MAPPDKPLPPMAAQIRDNTVAIGNRIGVMESSLGRVESSLGRATSSLGRVMSSVGGVASSLGKVETVLDTMRSSLRDQLSELNEAQADSAKEISRLHTELERFATRHDQQIQRLVASVELGNLEADFHRRFGPNAEVRSNVRDVLYALESGWASELTKRLIEGTKVVDVQQFWLAAMLKAIVAWIRDDRDGATYALHAARNLDAGRCALFACLLNARHGRLLAAEGWLVRYLDEEEARALSAEFVPILDAAMVGALGRTARERVEERCLRWHEATRNEPALRRRQIDRWGRELKRHAVDLDGAVERFARTYPTLRRVSPWAEALAAELQATAAFPGLAAALRRQVDEGAPTDRDGARRINQILRSLAERQGPEELALRAEMDKRKIVGSAEDYRIPADHVPPATELPAETTVDLLTALTDLVLRPERHRVSPVTVRLATYLNVPWIVEAVEQARAATAAKASAPVPIQIADWSGDLKTGEGVERLEASLAASMDILTDADESKGRRTLLRTSAASTAIGGAGLTVLNLVSGGAVRSPLTVVLVCVATIAAAAFAAVRISAPERTQTARRLGEQRKQAAVQALREAGAEHARLSRDWHRRLETADELIALVRSLDRPAPALDDEVIERDATASARKRQDQPATSPPEWDLTLD